MLLYKSDPRPRPLGVPRESGRLNGGDAAAWELHGGVVELDLGATIEVVYAGTIGGDLADGSNLDGSLVLVPLLRLGLGRGVVLIAALGVLGHLLSVADHGLLLDGGGVVHGVGVVLGSVGVKRLTHVGALAGDGGEARAAGDGGSHTLGGVGHIDGAVLALVLGTGHLEGRVDVCVHGGDAGVTLLNNVEGLLHRGLCALEHDRLVLLDRVVLHVLHVVLVHLLVEVGERGGAVHDMSLRKSLTGNDSRDGPGHGRLVGSRRSLAHVGLGGAIIHDLVGVEATLVRAALVLDHGGLAAEALEAAVVGALVGTLSGVDATVAGERRGVRESLAAAEMLALVRLFAGVSSDVDSQGAALNEALAAAGNGARVGTLVGVNSVVALKIRLAVEALLGDARSARCCEL